MARKKRATKKTPAKKKPKICTSIKHPASVDDFFDDETGELLNPRHELFAQEWARSFDRAAALAAGKYSKPKTRATLRKNSDLILRREEVQRRIRAILRAEVTDMAVTEDWVILKMLDVYEKALEEKPIMDAEGNVVGYEYKDLRVAQQTLKELGINLGMFQKKDDSRAASVVINMNYGGQLPGSEQPPAIEGRAKRLN
jgi:hypothetical protein